MASADIQLETDCEENGLVVPLTDVGPRTEARPERSDQKIHCDLREGIRK